MSQKQRRAKRQARSAPAGSAPIPGWSRWLWLLPALAAILLYLGTLRNGFVLDDPIILLEDPRMGDLANFFRLRAGELVVRYWSLLIDSAIWGTRPFGYHLTNMLLHAGVGVVLFVHLRTLAQRIDDSGRAPRFLAGIPWADWTAVVAALLYVAHPMLTEAVAGVTHRKEILATGFMLLALHRSLGPRRGPGRSAEVTVWLALAIFAKAPAVVFFPLALAQDLWVRRRPLRVWLREDLRFYLLPTLAGIGYVVYRWGGLSLAAEDPKYFKAYNPQMVGVDEELRLLTSARTLGLYWQLMVDPFTPALDRFIEPVRSASRPLPWLMIAAAAGALAAAWRLGRRQPLVALGLVWLVLSPLPTLNIIPLNFLFSERYLYLPMVGAALLVAGLVRLARTRIPAAGWTTLVVTAVLLALFTGTTLRRNAEWRDTETLLAATVRDNRDAPRVRYFHARSLDERGRTREALEEVRAALTRQPGYPEAWHLAGRLLGSLGRGEESIEAFERALEQARRPPAAWWNDYGVALAQTGRPAEAAEAFGRAAAEETGDLQIRLNHAQSLLVQDSTMVAGVALLERTIRENPEFDRAWLLLGEVRLGAGDSTAVAEIAGRGRAALGDTDASRYLEGLRLEATGDPDGAYQIYYRLLEKTDLETGLQERTVRAIRRAARAAGLPLPGAGSR